MRSQLRHVEATHTKLCHEMPALKRLKFATSSEQKSLLQEAIDYSLKRWTALTHYLGDGDIAADNYRAESLIRPIALGRKNWLFSGSLRAGQRAATLMSLLHTAKRNGISPRRTSRMRSSDCRLSRPRLYTKCCP